MQRFAIECVLECPSDWDAEKCREYVNRLLLSSEDEKRSLQVIDEDGVRHVD